MVAAARHPVNAYPLAWPAGVPRTGSPKRASFSDVDAQKKRIRKQVQPAFVSLREELRRLGAVSPVISSNLPLRDDGVPYAEANCKEHGIAVYWHLREYRGGAAAALVPYSMPCDRFDRVADNLYAVAKTIEAMRAIERYGAVRTAQVFAGFAALPPGDGAVPSEPVKPWRDVFGGSWPDGLEPAELLILARSRYQRAARAAHPDLGGDADRMLELNRSIAEAEAELGGDRG